MPSWIAKTDTTELTSEMTRSVADCILQNYIRIKMLTLTCRPLGGRRRELVFACVGM